MSFGLLSIVDCRLLMASKVRQVGIYLLLSFRAGWLSGLSVCLSIFVCCLRTRNCRSCSYVDPCLVGEVADLAGSNLCEFVWQWCLGAGASSTGKECMCVYLLNSDFPSHISTIIERTDTTNKRHCLTDAREFREDNQPNPINQLIN
jgi:hypothetical protein